MTSPPVKPRVRGLATALVSLILLTIGSICSVVAVLGVWWKGALSDTTFAQLASAGGELSLWTFVAHSDVLGAVTLTSKPINLDSSALCGGSNLLVKTQEVCDGIQATRAFVGAAIAFSIVATLAGFFSVAALLNCGGKFDSTMGTRLLPLCSALATAAAGLMIVSMVTGATAGHRMGLGNFGTLSYAMGPGVYCAIFQIIACLLGAGLATSAWNGIAQHDTRHAHLESHV